MRAKATSIGTKNGLPSSAGDGVLIVDDHDITIAYDKDQIVIVAGLMYRANSDILANVAFVEGTGANQWTVIGSIDGQSIIPDFSDQVNYLKHTVILSGGVLYRAKALTPKAAWDEIKWDKIEIPVTMAISTFVANQTYDQNEIFEFLGHNYQVTIDWIGAASVLPDAPIKRLGFLPLTVHTENQLYLVGDPAYVNGRLHRCIAAHTGPSSPDIKNWVDIGHETPVYFIRLSPSQTLRGMATLDFRIAFSSITGCARHMAYPFAPRIGADNETILLDPMMEYVLEFHSYLSEVDIPLRFELITAREFSSDPDPLDGFCLPGGATVSIGTPITGNPAVGHSLGAEKIAVAVTKGEGIILSGTETGIEGSSYLKVTVMGTLMGHG